MPEEVDLQQGVRVLLPVGCSPRSGDQLVGGGDDSGGNANTTDGITVLLDKPLCGTSCARNQDVVAFIGAFDIQVSRTTQCVTTTSSAARDRSP